MSFLGFYPFSNWERVVNKNLGVKGKCPKVTYLIFLTGFRWRISLLSRANRLGTVFNAGLRDSGLSCLSLFSLARSEMAIVRLPRDLSKNFFFFCIFLPLRGREPHFRLRLPPIIWLHFLLPLPMSGEGIELSNQENNQNIRTLGEKKTCRYSGILGADIIKQAEKKEKIKNEYLRRTRKNFETKLYSRNLIKGINTCVVPLVKYSRPFLKWAKEELHQMDQRTRKLMTMHKALHPRDDICRQYVSRKEGGRGLYSIQRESIDTKMRRMLKKKIAKKD